MENRKEYIEPEMKIMHLASQTNLLDDSCAPDECLEDDGFGFAPFKQDPLA